MLFEVEKYSTAEKQLYQNSESDPAEQMAAPSVKLTEVINQVSPGITLHWLSGGDWSMHQLLEKLLALTGPAEVWISSYAFSETPARIIAEHKRAGAITKLHCIIDNRVDVRSASAVTMMRNASDRIKLTDTHAKVTVIRNDNWFLVVCGSANYTTNKRYEAGMISCNPVVASFHLKWIENEIA